MLNIKIDIYIYIIKNNTLIILNNVNNLKKKSEFQTCFLSFVVEAESRAFPLMDDRETVVETRVNIYYNLFYCVNLKISWYRWLRNSRVV